MVRRVWGRRGVKVYQPLQLTYEWQYLFLVVNGRAGTLHPPQADWIDSMAADEVLAAVGVLQQATDVEALIWDRAPSHRDGDAPRGHPAVGLRFIGLPPYSPELNPAERVLQELRRAIEGKVYPTLADKVAAVDAELTKLAAEPASVRSLAGTGSTALSSDCLLLMRHNQTQLV